MKKNKYKILIVLVIGLFVLVPGIVFAAKIIESNKVSYDNSKTGLPNNVQGALDTLYTRQNNETNNWKKKYYDAISKNANNAPLVDYIRGVLKDDGSTIVQDDGTLGHNMRYIGANPKNWVSFNGGLWRIIGVFGTDSHGQAEELVKIQFSASLGNIKWDETNVNDWSKATLKTYLNEGEYYTSKLNATAKNMIQAVDWKLGAAPWLQSTMYADVFYKYERGNVGAKSNPTLTEWNGNVALAYPSDYIFSTSGGATHNRAECLATPARNVDNTANALWRTDGANAGECATGSWMIQQARNMSTHPWTLTPGNWAVGYIFDVWSNTSLGAIGGPSVNGTNYGVVPAVYLKSNVICTNCNDSTAGTETNPYILSIE